MHWNYVFLALNHQSDDLAMIDGVGATKPISFIFIT